jgi:hypothetical protein
MSMVWIDVVKMKTAFDTEKVTKQREEEEGDGGGG